MGNMMTCEGYDTGIMGGCSQAWITFAIVLFLGLVLRRQCSDGVFSGTKFSFIFAMIVGLGLNIIMSTLFGDARWSLLGGLVGLAIGGFIGGQIFEGGGAE